MLLLIAQMGLWETIKCLLIAISLPMTDEVGSGTFFFFHFLFSFSPVWCCKQRFSCSCWPWLSCPGSQTFFQFSRSHFAVHAADVDEGVPDRFGSQLTWIWNCWATHPRFAGRVHRTIATPRKGERSAQPRSRWKPQSLGAVRYTANS